MLCEITPACNNGISFWVPAKKHLVGIRIGVLVRRRLKNYYLQIENSPLLDINTLFLFSCQ